MSAMRGSGFITNVHCFLSNSLLQTKLGITVLLVNGKVILFCKNRPLHLDLVELSFSHSWICLGAQQGAQLEIASNKITGNRNKEGAQKITLSSIRVRSSMKSSRVIELLRKEGLQKHVYFKK